MCDCERIDHFWGDVEKNFCSSQYKELCVRPMGAQARIKGSPDLETDQVVTFDMNGFRCDNADQTESPFFCHDYEIRYCCEVNQDTGDTTCSDETTSPPKNCDLTWTEIFEEDPDAPGSYRYGEKYKLRKGEGLENPAKIGKKTGVLKHDQTGKFSDVWVVCKNNR